MTDRQREILFAIIEEYAELATPVGSVTLAKLFDCSSATIRAEMGKLEQMGYIMQPHTSAGRIPTDYGYRTFVDRLVDSGAISDDPETLEKLNNLRAAASELDDMIERTSAALARFTDCLTIVAPQDLPHPRRMGMSSLMRQPEFAYTQSLLPIMQVLEDESVLLEILDSTAQDADSPRVRIGRENEAEQFSGVSVVASRYGSGSDEGIIAVIGPTRMDYTKVLQAVKIACRSLSQE